MIGAIEQNYGECLYRPTAYQGVYKRIQRERIRGFPLCGTHFLKKHASYIFEPSRNNQYVVLVTFIPSLIRIRCRKSITGSICKQFSISNYLPSILFKSLRKNIDIGIILCTNKECIVNAVYKMLS